MKLLMLSVGRGRYAVAASAVTRIIDPRGEPAGEPGGVPEHLPGDRQPVDLYALAGETAPASAILLHLDHAGRSAVLAVDQVDDICEVPTGEIAPIPAFVFEGTSRMVRGVLRDEGGLRLLLDERLLA